MSDNFKALVVNQEGDKFSREVKTVNKDRRNNIMPTSLVYRFCTKTQAMFPTTIDRQKIEEIASLLSQLVCH